VPAGVTAGALIGIASDRLVSATIAGLIAGLALGLLFSWITKTKGDSS
jgi:F0F1-type ATP synthase assembly protein I